MANIVFWKADDPVYHTGTTEYIKDSLHTQTAFERAMNSPLEVLQAPLDLLKEIDPISGIFKMMADKRRVNADTTLALEEMGMMAEDGNRSSTTTIVILAIIVVVIIVAFKFFKKKK